jgi:hypothetical protein
MTVTRGKTHTFLGMNFVFNENETVTVSMKTYLNESITESKMEINSKATSPAGKGLFELDPTSPLLAPAESDRFHSVVAKQLYVAIRARPNLLLAVSFLCTRVAKSTVQDQRKLKRLLQYIYGTIDITLTLGADDLHSIRTWVDASYAVHPDVRSHTGGVISMGMGAIMSKSSKQKINTKSSTEAELVGATDFLPNTIWPKMFLEAQGFTLNENVFEQDNVSAMRPEKNGRSSAGKQSRHIDIRYFSMKDRIVVDGINLRHCPTEAMLADFLTKPLQGALFRKFRDVLLGYKHTRTLSEGVTNMSSTEERLEGNEIEYEMVKRENVSEDQYSDEFDTDFKELASTDGEGNENASGSTASTVSDTWSLVAKKKKGKMPVTSNPVLKIKRRWFTNLIDL